MYSSVPSGPGLSQLNLECELKLYAVESSDFFFELFPDPGAGGGRIFSEEALGSAPYLSGASICQPLKKLPITHGVCLNVITSVFLLLVNRSRISC